MVRVLHYAPGFKSGGIESRLLDWYRNMDREAVQFVLVKLNAEDDTPNISEFVSLGGVFYDLPRFTLKNLPAFISKIRKILIDEKIDIVHVHDVNSGFFVLREAERLGIQCRIIHSRTTSYLPRERNVFAKSFLRRRIAKHANHYFACSTEAGLWGIGEKYQDDIVVIKNGIQTDRFCFNEEARHHIRSELGVDDCLVVGTVSRLSDQKNLPFLLRAFTEFSKDSKSALVIVGDGDRGIISGFYGGQIPDNVFLAGNKKEVWDYYFAFDVFCATSSYEGFGTTAIESQAAGLPTIVSKGFPETVCITDHIWRLPTDSPKQWSEAMACHVGERFPDGPSDVKEAGYDAQDVARDLESFYLGHC